MISNSFDAFVQELNAAYATENMLVDAMQEMISEASNGDLVASLETHLGETQEHVNRLDSVFEELDLTPEGGCATASALINETQDNISSADSPEAVDVAIGNGAIKAEYLELATYSALKLASVQLGLSQDVEHAIDSNYAEDSAALDIAQNNAPALLAAAA